MSLNAAVDVNVQVLVLYALEHAHYTPQKCFQHIRSNKWRVTDWPIRAPENGLLSHDDAV